jgi:hypothetical protein
MKRIIPILLLAIAAFSCQPAKEKTTEIIPPSNFDQARTEFLRNMRSAKEAAAQIEATAADFNPTLMNIPIDYAELSKDTLKRAANLGIYLADLNYSAAYKQSKNSQDAFQSAFKLSKSIGIDETMLAFIAQRFEANISQHDSVKSAFNELFTQATENIQGPQKERILGVVMAGYEMENLHLALGVIQTYPKDILPEDSRTQILIPVFKMVLEQESNVEKIYNFLRTLGDPSDPERTPNFAFFDKSFSELLEVYQRLNVQEAIANNQASALLNDAVVAELSEKVNAIRNKIVTP